MSKLSKSTWNTIWAGTSGNWATNGVRAITATIMRQFATDAADTFYPPDPTTVTAANFIACGTTPVTLVSAPAAGSFLSVQKIVVSKKAGTTAFAFTDNVIIKLGSEVIAVIDAAELNITGSVNFSCVIQGQKCAAATALTITTADAANSATGDSDVSFIPYYTVETVLT